MTLPVEDRSLSKLRADIQCALDCLAAQSPASAAEDVSAARDRVPDTCFTGTETTPEEVASVLKFADRLLGVSTQEAGMAAEELLGMLLRLL